MPSDPTTPTPSEPLELRESFLLVKRGLYYGPNNSGYTGIKERAGRYLESDADPESGIVAVHENDAPMFSKACWEDVKVGYLLDIIKQQASTIEALEKGLRAIVAGNVPRPVRDHWRADKAPSKHDMCAHGVEMYADCSNCTAAFIETLLPKENNNDR